MTWIYDCDSTTFDGRRACAVKRTITQGDECSTGRGTVVHDQADADAVARQDGWKLGRTFLCPFHNQAGAA